MSGPRLWGGRQPGALDPAFEACNRSLPFDRRLVDEDLVGSMAWARALGGAGVLEAADVDALVAALAELRDEVAADPERLAASPAEDVHAFVESALGEKVGDLAKRLHTGRSRNDQVATDVRLFLRAEAKDLDGCIRQLVAELVALAEREAATPLPGYTHLQRAQPITAGHHALCYAEMLYRDAGRLCDAAARLDESPLGCGALAGTAFPVDREALAADLGFGRAAHNSLDAVASRDGILEVVFACTTALVTLSRLAEDWIFFASQEAGFLTMGDEVTTGSSLMPQKKNPDALELIRGKCARVIGHLTALASLQKGLPLAYDKDLQEDKEALFEALDTTGTCLEVAALVVRDLVFDRDRARAACAVGYLDATDLADLLVKRGVPFREAHDRVGAAVNAAIEEGVPLERLSDEARAATMPELDGVDLAGELGTDALLARRDVVGGTAVARVEAEVARWREALAGAAS